MKFRKAAALLVILSLLLTGCASSPDAKQASTKLSFKEALSYDALKELDGKPVTINGYLATSSPVDGSFIFLMNLPFQNCPFCVPNTSQLSNTMEVYPKEGERFSYTNQAVKVEGILSVAEDPEQPFVDLYGYEFAFKIQDASFTILKGEDVSEELALWQKFASTDIINEIYAMYDYVNFVCSWNNYFVNSSDDGNGNIYPGYYLYASDAEKFLKEEDGQYHYGYVDNYFDDLIAKIQAVDPDAFADLVANIEQAKALAADALQDLEDGNYTYESQYVERFENTDYVYTLNRGEEFQQRFDELFYGFSLWLSGWEL